MRWTSKFLRASPLYRFDIRNKGFFSGTINNPVFPFTIHPTRKPQHKLMLSWCEFFKLRAKDVTLPEFILHDGPPYANGCLHVGHALNKFLKDIIVRYKLLSGYCVNFIPGWDCHGLPIELKAVENQPDCSPRETRQKASAVARRFVDLQKSSFIDWGVIADWSEYYTTMDRVFEQTELEVFSTLHAKGLIYRDRLPVHWSYAARTALAESELEYNSEHVSPSVYIRIRMHDLGTRLAHKLPASAAVYGVVWTTTPWTVPSNEAVAYDPNASYILLKASPSNDFYIVSNRFVEQLNSMFCGLHLSKVDEILGADLAQCSYVHPIRCRWKNGFLTRPFLPSTHVIDSKGTGLVHCAPCHGKEDFIVGQQFSLPMRQIVDETGHFTSDAGTDLSGLPITQTGTNKVLELLQSAILHLETVKHSYPYDWRTKTPVIIRLSDQWFLDTAIISNATLEAYQSVVVIPPNQKPSMFPFISSRPRWCLSRQRAWGVPIPVLLRKQNNQPIVDHEFIHHISQRMGQTGSDFWFNESVEELVPQCFWKKVGYTFLCDACMTLGSILLNSPWKSSLQSTRAFCLIMVSPSIRGYQRYGRIRRLVRQWRVVVECSGRSVVVHGLTADSDGRKMSKSVGNVISPKDLLERHDGCVDILRHWAACSALDSVTTVGHKEVDQHAARYKALRNSLRFMLGNLSDFQPLNQLYTLTGCATSGLSNMNDLVLQLIKATCPSSLASSTSLGVLDRAVLCWLGRLVQGAVHIYYPNCRFSTLLSEVDQLVSRLSSIYVTAMKDSLYCDPIANPSRRVAQTVFWLTTECLKAVLAPILPYLMEEVDEASRKIASMDHAMAPLTFGRSLLERYAGHTLSDSDTLPPKSVKSDWLVCLTAMQNWSHYTEYADAVELVYALYLAILNEANTQSVISSSSVNPLSKFHVEIYVNPSNLDSKLIRSLRLLQPGTSEVNSHSDLCKLLRAASVYWLTGQLRRSDSPAIVQLQFQDTVVLVSLRATTADCQCPRCLRFTRIPQLHLCSRCVDALAVRTECTSV
ncbi:isoleucyl-tRNA synthetase [Paragonimus westermani]|uniref:isoleucine--tRNA ligase n=1 Tax=Paragonimus westermani TaxID=34504 RepID=A0A5J4NPM3_9TREM|nr:isoleucyl-tRNA synthetase [Paragonimus westermani]